MYIRWRPPWRHTVICLHGAYFVCRQHYQGALHVVFMKGWCIYSSSVKQCLRSVNQELSHRLHSPHNPKPQLGHFNNFISRRPRSEKPLETSGSHTFLSFSCFSIASQEAVGRCVVLLLRIKGLGLQKRSLFVLFALGGTEPPPYWMSQYYAQ